MGGGGGGGGGSFYETHRTTNTYPDAVWKSLDMMRTEKWLALKLPLAFSSGTKHCRWWKDDGRAGGGGGGGRE